MVKLDRRSQKYNKFKHKYYKQERKCYVCGTNRKLTLHHIIPIKESPFLMLREDNIKCLCKKHHKEFHELYGVDGTNLDSLKEYRSIVNGHYSNKIGGGIEMK